jgi:hypothetical protein
MDILTEKNKVLNVLAEELLDKEILSVDDIYNLILNNIPEDEKDYVNQQYEKAKEIKIDSSSHLKKPSVKDSSEKAQEKKTENNTDKKEMAKNDTSDDDEKNGDTKSVPEKKRVKKESDKHKKEKTLKEDKE